MGNYRILEYYAENFKRLRLVEFKPTNRVTVFTGKNDQGKTSALDAIPFVLGGKKWSPEIPKRKGATRMKVKLNLGEFTVERTETGMTLEMAAGSKAWGTPQKMLDSIFDELAFDPIEFIRTNPKRQVEMLRGATFTTEQLREFDLADAASKDDFVKRTAVNGDAKRLETEAAAIQSGLPKAKIDEEAIAAKIRGAGDHNKEVIAQIEAKTKLGLARAEADAALERNNVFIQAMLAKMPSLAEDVEVWPSIASRLGEFEDEIEAWRRLLRWPHGDRLNDAVASTASAISAYKLTVKEHLETSQRDWQAARNALDAAQEQTSALAQALSEADDAWQNAPVGELLETNALLEELQQAQTTNREIDKRTRREALEAQRDAKERESRELTRKMDAREEHKRRAIEKAKMPIEGLSFTEDQVLFEGIPLQQLGEAKQIRISIALVLARNPKLRLVRIPNGEALDDDSMAELAKMAEEMDFYVWMAKVDSTGKIGIYIEDGEIKAVNE
jgi:hypothetical protein